MRVVIAANRKDYSLIGRCAELAAEEGLVAAEWYHTEIPRKRMKELMRRRNGPALLNTAIWFALLAAFAVGIVMTWGTWVWIPLFLVYSVLYGSASDSRWHEAGHGTAFRTQWLNDALYQVASFMNLKEPTFWRWSHARHHTDTIIVGRDREIPAMRPPDVLRLLLDVFGIRVGFETLLGVGRHSAGVITEEEKDFIPESEHRRVCREARAWVAIFLLLIGAAVYLDSLLPLLLIGPVPTLCGFWLGYLFAVTQHTGLAENVLDHRLNSRTLYLNPVLRFVFWNMNYHIEHHMFPMVPSRSLAELHAEVRHDMPPPYRGMIAAYREILPTLWRQLRDPRYHVARSLPPSAKPFRPELHKAVYEV